jgi:hypothetical protein
LFTHCPAVLLVVEQIIWLFGGHCPFIITAFHGVRSLHAPSRHACRESIAPSPSCPPLRAAQAPPPMS